MNFGKTRPRPSHATLSNATAKQKVPAMRGLRSGWRGLTPRVARRGRACGTGRRPLGFFERFDEQRDRFADELLLQLTRDGFEFERKHQKANERVPQQHAEQCRCSTPYHCGSLTDFL